MTLKLIMCSAMVLLNLSVGAQKLNTVVLGYNKARIDLDSIASKIPLKCRRKTQEPLWLKKKGWEKFYIIKDSRSILKNEFEKSTLIEFTPGKSGKVKLVFRGPYVKVGGKRYHLAVDYMNIKVDGAEILNADFSKLDVAGKPEGWKLHKGAKLMKDEESGKKYIRVTHDNPAYIIVKVIKDQKVKLTADIRAGK